MDLALSGRKTLNLKLIILSPYSSAVDTETGQLVALKKLARPFQSPVHAKRAYREIKLMKLLTCTNTNVRIYHIMCNNVTPSSLGCRTVRCVHT